MIGSKPAFSKRHYEAVAEVIRDCLAATPPEQRLVASRFARLFRGDNPNFKRPTFMKACGLPEDT